MPFKPTETNPGVLPGSFKYTPLQRVRELYVAFVQGLFGAAPVGCYHWSEFPEESEIYISDENPVKSSIVGKRPAVSFVRGPLQFYSLGFDDMLKYDAASGKKQKSVLVPGTMSINCLSRVDLECDNLAWVITEHIWLLRDMLMKVGFFEVGRQPTIGSPSPAGSLVEGEGADGWYVVTVNCPFQFYRTSQFTPLGERVVAGVELSLGTAINNVLSAGLPNSSGHPDLPYQVNTQAPEPFSPASDARGGKPNALPPRQCTAKFKMPGAGNPSQVTKVQPVLPTRPGLRPPSIYGRTIPLSTCDVEQSEPQSQVVATAKV